MHKPSLTVLVLYVGDQLLGVVFVQVCDAYLRAFLSEEESCLPPGPRSGPDGDRWRSLPRLKMRTFTPGSGLRKTRRGRGSHLVVLLDETPRHTHRTRDLVSDKEGLAAGKGHQGPPVARL